METVVRIGKAMVEWTPQGWKTDDPYIAEFCEFVWNGGAGGFHWDFDPSKADARQLVAACRERKMDAEIISFGPFTHTDLPGYRD